MTVKSPELQQYWTALRPLLSIRNEHEYDQAAEWLNRLLDEVGTNEQHPLYTLLDTLGTLLHAYEEQHHPIPECSGVELLRFLMEEHALTQPDLPEVGSQGSVPAAFEALLRAVQIADTAPRGSTYVNLDAALQEAKIGPMPALPDIARFKAPAPVLPAQEAIEQAARLLSAAKNPVILAGHASRAESDWKNRIAVAEKLHAQVMTDLKGGAAFPTDHPLHPVPPAAFLSDEGKKLLRDADVDRDALQGALPAGGGKQPLLL